MLDKTRIVKLNGISSADMGLMLSNVKPLLFPRRSKAREPRLHNLAALESVYWMHQPAPIRLEFTAEGANKAGLVNMLQNVGGWLLQATELRLWYDLDKYYTGSIDIDDSSGDFELIVERYGTIAVDFICNPPCWHKIRSKQAGFQLAAGVPIPEQITAGTETVSRSNAGDLPGVTYTAAQPAALYFAITGTWSSLSIGGASGLVIPYTTPQSMTLYIDCEAQVVYHKLGGVMTAVPYSGDFPVLTRTGPAAVAVAGSNLEATARMLVIERG